jgi:hypothetical protein
MGTRVARKKGGKGEGKREARDRQEIGKRGARKGQERSKV